MNNAQKIYGILVATAAILIGFYTFFKVVSGLPPDLNVTDLLAYGWSQKHESWKRYQDIAKDAL